MGVKYNETTGIPSNEDTNYNKLLEMWREEKQKREKSEDKIKELEGTLGSAQDINDSYQRDISKLQQSVEEVKADLAREKEDRQYDNLVHKKELEKHLKPLDGSER
jgi:thiamine kinase-like enzyme